MLEWRHEGYTPFQQGAPPGLRTKSDKTAGKGQGPNVSRVLIFAFSGSGRDSRPLDPEPPYPLTLCYGPGLAFAGAAR